MPRRRKDKVDSNQAEIVKELRQAGFSVEVGHDDILVGKWGLTAWIEIKTNNGKLKPAQERLLKEWQGAYAVARSTEDVLRIMNNLRYMSSQKWLDAGSP